MSLPETLTIVSLTHTDTTSLAQLMLDAYRGTVDDAGETLADALHEVHGFWAGTAGVTPWAEVCTGVMAGDALVAACVVGEWQSRQVPLIAYVLTHPAWQRRGLASALVGRALQHLWQHQRWPVYAVITAGNLPSERMMMRVGFERLEQTLV
jgi:RimJ/RimL family protein N-acetyltransferase